jgi:hypothetical protein
MRRADLPSGAVTLLFTDVEGSTRLLDELGADAYAAALAEHRRIVREVCMATVVWRRIRRETPFLWPSRLRGRSDCGLGDPGRSCGRKGKGADGPAYRPAATD